MGNFEFKGTKGKWHINHWSKGDSGVMCVKIDKNGISEYTGDAVNEPFFGIRSNVGLLGHNVQGSFEGAHICDVVAFSDESKANALLISKAPEMLEMLIDFVETYESGGVINNEYYIDKFKQLIKEATEL